MAKILVSLSTSQMTILFSASPWHGELPIVYTEYVWLPPGKIGDEQEAVRRAVMQAAERASKQLNKDQTMVAANMMKTKKVFTIADGFVSMTSIRKIQRR